jgi:hypothetical protein
MKMTRPAASTYKTLTSKAANLLDSSGEILAVTGIYKEMEGRNLKHISWIRRRGIPE